MRRRSEHSTASAPAPERGSGAPREPPVSFRDRDIEAQLDARGRDGQSRGTIASRDLARYYALLDRSLRSVSLSEAEASLVCDALNGVLHTEHDAHLLWAGVDDAIQGDGLAEKWGVDGPSLVARLRDLSPGQAMAVVDAAERYWHRPNEAGALRAVGLVR